MIEFFLPMEKIPTTTHQQKKVNVRNGKPIFYEPEELKNARTGRAKKCSSEIRELACSSRSTGQAKRTSTAHGQMVLPDD